MQIMKAARMLLAAAVVAGSLGMATPEVFADEDDVVVDGPIVTAQDYDSARVFDASEEDARGDDRAGEEEPSESQWYTGYVEVSPEP